MLIGPRRGDGQRENSKNPQVRFELIDGNHLDVVATWPPGDDVEPFARMLLLICQGRMIGPISAAVAIHGSGIDEREKAVAINSVIQDSLRRDAERTDDDDADEPIVCPTEAIKLNTKSFMG